MEEWTTQLLRDLWDVKCLQNVCVSTILMAMTDDRQDETETALTQCPVLTVLGVDGDGAGV